MNELLLTPEEEIEYRRNHPKDNLTWLVACPEWYRDLLCQAQLNKVLNQPKLDKPDGEGWWWYQPSKGDSHMRPGFLYLLNASYARLDETPVDIDEFPNGKWSKAIVPEKE